MAWPTTNNPRTEFVTLRLTADEAAELDAYASARGESRSVAVREAVARVIAADQRKARRAQKQKAQQAQQPEEKTLAD